MKVNLKYIALIANIETSGVSAIQMLILSTQQFKMYQNFLIIAKNELTITIATHCVCCPKYILYSRYLEFFGTYLNFHNFNSNFS